MTYLNQILFFRYLFNLGHSIKILFLIFSPGLLATTLPVTNNPHNLFQLEQKPELFCQESHSCTDSMTSITEDFTQGDLQSFVINSIQGYSGDCFYISAIYDPERQHHGAFLFTQNQTVAGVFSFFSELNPYDGLSSLQLLDHFEQTQASFDPFTISKDYLELRYLTETSDFHYWFRFNQSLNQLLLIGQQRANDDQNFLFCRLNPLRP